MPRKTTKPNERKTRTKWDFNAKRVYLTYPQCSLSKGELIEELGKVEEIGFYAACEEKHEDGSPHLHALLQYSKRVHRTDVRAFDVRGFHPNIRAVSDKDDLTRLLSYIKKHGDFTCTFPDTRGKRLILADKILSKGINKDLIKEHPEVIFLNHHNIKAWLRVFEDPVRPNISWYKAMHAWHYGPSNTGKSTFIDLLGTLYVTFEAPRNGDWGSCPKNVEIVVFEEYDGWLPIPMLNRICDGNVQLNTKGGSFHLPKCMIHIASNKSIDFCYPNEDPLLVTALKNRFTQYLAPSIPRFLKYKL